MPSTMSAALASLRQENLDLKQTVAEQCKELMACTWRLNLIEKDVDYSLRQSMGRKEIVYGVLDSSADAPVPSVAELRPFAPLPTLLCRIGNRYCLVDFDVG